jgi:hypothetical protein
VAAINFLREKLQEATGDTQAQFDMVHDRIREVDIRHQLEEQVLLAFFFVVCTISKI